jgi:hypothetical protein
MNNSLLEQAIAALEAGQAAEGQRLLAQVLRQEPNNEMAWLWMAEALAEPERKRYCIQRALASNPDSVEAHQLLAELDKPPAPIAPPASEPPAVAFSPAPAAPEAPLAPEAPRLPALATEPEKPVAEQLEEAMALMERKHIDEGVALLKRVVERDPRNEMGWLWLAASAGYSDQKRQYLDRVLEINPKNRMGRKMLAELGAPPEPSASRAPAARVDDERGEEYWGPGAWLAALVPSAANYESILSDYQVGLGRASKWVAAAGAVGYVMALLILLMRGGLKSTPTPGNWSPFVTLSLLLVCGGVLVAVVDILALWAGGGMMFFVGLLLGGRGSYTDVVYAMAAYQSPLILISYILSAIPVAGPWLAIPVNVYGMVLSVFAVKAAHRMGWLQALVTSLAPLLLAGCGLVALAMWLGPEAGRALQNGLR